jgi:hypothetical protein
LLGNDGIGQFFGGLFEASQSFPIDLQGIDILTKVIFVKFFERQKFFVPVMVPTWLLSMLPLDQLSLEFLNRYLELLLDWTQILRIVNLGKEEVRLLEIQGQELVDQFELLFGHRNNFLDQAK